jgi:hypothetical protein
MFYMLLSLATGIFYFTWAVTGIALSVSFSILIIGLPFIVLFFGTVRALSLVEGRIVEAMLGVRMPRRPPYPGQTNLSLGKRIAAMFTDARTWSTLLYMFLMLPLGTLYFTLAVTLLSVSIAFIGSPFAWMFDDVRNNATVDFGFGAHTPTMGDAMILCIVGTVLLFATMHLVRGLGKMQAAIAKHLLVRSSVD